MNAIDPRWMARALELAELGLWTTRPNPRVGCVIVKDDVLVGEGWHERAGGPHAEVHALAIAGQAARGATAYVTLEPCAHHGRTPPCADALVRAGVARVVVACGDPFEQVAGRGLQRLREAGIEVHTGILENQARALNCGFFSRLERGRPWVRAKLACSADGRSALADGRSQWLTGAQARADGHRWRARACAVMSGIGTVLGDDPMLNSRPAEAGEIAAQLRVIVDSRARTPANARLWQVPGRVLVATGPDARCNPGWPKSAEMQVLPTGAQVDLAGLLQSLARQHQLNEVHLEAGARLTGAMLAAGLVDELLLYQAPCLLGHAARPALELAEPASLELRQQLELLEVTPIGADLRLRYRIQAPAS